jgi:hypothetical protein
MPVFDDKKDIPEDIAGRRAHEPDADKYTPFCVPIVWFFTNINCPAVMLAAQSPPL